MNVKDSSINHYPNVSLKILLLLFLLIVGLPSLSAATGENIIITVAGNGTYGYSGDGGPAIEASIKSLSNVDVDSSGNIYISDNRNHRIRKVNANGIITTVAGNGSNGYSGDGGPATEASLNYPLGICVDSSGNIYFADMENQRIRMVDTSGIITTVAGNGIRDYSGDGGNATEASLKSPQDVAVDALGNIYIADDNNYRIRKVDTSGIIHTVAGNGSRGYSGDGGPATEASLNYFYGVAVDPAGNIYIADTYNSRIRKVDTSGIITTVAGNGTEGYSGDGGQATNANLKQPNDVALDASGNIYIADTSNNCIRKVDTSGIITTVAGNGTEGYSGDGGQATNANLKQPNGVALDTWENIYIGDNNNYRIRKVFLSGYVLGDVAPRGAPDGVVDVADALVMMRLASGLITPTPEEILRGNVAPKDNPDGQIDMADSLLVLRAALGLTLLSDDDTDGDGYTPSQGDCNNNDSTIYPGAPEIDCDGIDQDCDGSDSCPTTCTDNDGDGYGDPGDASCPNGSALDCDDSDPAVNPGATETPYNGKDDDCNPATVDDDLDGDGYPIATDCDDNDPASYPGAPEVNCDGVDQDCDGSDYCDDIPPTLSITSPIDGAFIDTTTPNIAISFSDSESGINTASFYAAINGVDSTSLFTVTGTGADYQITSALPVGNNVITSSISDNVGNTSNAVSNFQIGVLRAIPGATPTSGSGPLTVYFTTDGEDPLGTIEEFRWDYQGDGTWDTYDTVAMNYSYTYNNSGTYNAILEVTSSTGDTATDSITITVTNSPPVATADMVPSNGEVPLTVQLNGSATDNGSIVLYEWDFEGDGTFDWSSTTTGNTTYTYTSVGTYNAVFRVTDDEGTTAIAVAATTVISVGPPGSPTAQGSASPTNGLAPLTVNFGGSGTDPDGTISLYEWDFDGDGLYDWTFVPTETNSWGTSLADVYVNDMDCWLLSPQMQLTEDSTLIFSHYFDSEEDYDGGIVEITTDGVNYTKLVPQGGYPYNVLDFGLGIGSYSGSLGGWSQEIFDLTGYTGQTIQIRFRFLSDYSITEDGWYIDDFEINSTLTGLPLFLDDMENGTNGWTQGGTNDIWELGVPTSGPGQEPVVTYIYNDVGTYIAAFRVTDNDGNTGIDYLPIDVEFQVSLSIESDQTFNPSLGESVGITIDVNDTVPASLLIRDGNGSLVKTISVDTSTATTINASWDGTDDSNIPVNDGLYYAVLQYQYQGTWYEYDLTNSTGGDRYDFPTGSLCDERDLMTPSFAPYEDILSPITFRLCNASEVTVFIGPLSNTIPDQVRIRTILNRVPLPAGSYTVYWDGLDDQGNIAHPAPGDELILGMFRYSLPDNAIYVTGQRPVITNISSDPNYFSPLSKTCLGSGDAIDVTYTVSEDVSTLELQVISLSTKNTVRVIQANNVPAGQNNISWDVRNTSGDFVEPGDYQLVLIATDAEGNDSMLTSVNLVRVSY